MLPAVIGERARAWHVERCSNQCKHMTCLIDADGLRMSRYMEVKPDKKNGQSSHVSKHPKTNPKEPKLDIFWQLMLYVICHAQSSNVNVKVSSHDLLKDVANVCAHMSLGSCACDQGASHDSQLRIYRVRWLCCSLHHVLLQGLSPEAYTEARSFWQDGACLGRLTFLPTACWQPLMLTLLSPLRAACMPGTRAKGLSPQATAAAAAALVAGTPVHTIPAR